MKKILFVVLMATQFVCNGKSSIAAHPTTFCNPINLDYGWGAFQTKAKNVRSAADPVVVLFKGKYYLFTTMDIGGYRVSNDLMTWKNIAFEPSIREAALNGNEYTAPAVAADDKYIYFIKFNRDRSQKTVDVIRSANPESGKWERWGKVRRMSDPTLFIDNGRFYFYYGLGAEQSTKMIEMDATTGQEVPGTEKLLREYITDVNECKSGYQFGRRELFDEIDASALKGKFVKLPCPEGAWVIKNKNKYYLQYATPGTISWWYCDVVLESDSPTGPFVEQPYNPVSLKVGGFIGGAGHSSVFKDKYGNWWQATTMWLGNHEPFERRVGLFPVSFDAQGRMRVHTVLGDYPMLLPQKVYTPEDVAITNWSLQSFNKICTASSELPGFEAAKASDENARTWWSAKTGNKGEWLSMNLGKKVRINALQINFAEQDVDTALLPKTDFHAYKLYTSNDGKIWKMLIDKSQNKKAIPHDYIELPTPVEAKYIKIENLHMAKGGKFALLDLRVFGFGNSTAPKQIIDLKINRDLQDERYASLTWSKVDDADGYLVRFGYAPDFLNQCVQVKGKENASLLLHILTKGIKYYYRVDTYSDSGITEGVLVKE